jgi:hypothetical protein
VAHSASGLRFLALSEGPQLIGALRAFGRRVALSNVRFRGANGKHMLTVSSSDSDPQRHFCCDAERCALVGLSSTGNLHETAPISSHSSAARQLIALSQRERRICNYKLQLRCTVQLAPAARSSAHNFSALARLSAPTWTRAQPMLPRASP